MSDSDLVCYCLSGLLCGFAFLFVLMANFFGFPSILLHFSFPVTDDLFLLGFVDVCCYFVLLYPGLELRFCSSFSRFVFGSFWPLCWFSCVKSFHLCICFFYVYCSGLGNSKKVWPLSDSDLVRYCLCGLLYRFAFFFVLMSKNLWLSLYSSAYFFSGYR